MDKQEIREWVNSSTAIVTALERDDLVKLLDALDAAEAKIADLYQTDRIKTNEINLSVASYRRKERWARLWKRTAKTRRAWLLRYKERLGKAAEEDERLRAALLAAMNFMSHFPRGQHLTDGETVELETAVRLASEALEGAS